MTKIVLIGAGSLQFGTGMLGDIFQSKILVGSTIVLNDINHQAALKTLAVGKEFIQKHNLDFSISAQEDQKAALKGADYVIISIEVGDRFALWDIDWKVPLQYGIKQVYGENGGPGGLFHSLRIIPPILGICENIIKSCPNAIVFNYSNPMSRICTTVQRKFPELKFIGMCHEISSLNEHLPNILGHPITNIKYRAAGLNHFSVMTEVKYIDSNKDAYPEVMEKAPNYFTNLPGFKEFLDILRTSGKTVETEGWMTHNTSQIKNIRPWSDRWLFKTILEKFKRLPITTDSHLGEYIQWAHECSDHRGIMDFYEYYRHYLGSIPPSISNETKERIVPIIEGIITNSHYEEYAVNIPNLGYIDCLPEWIAVEVPAVINKNGINGIKIDNLPAGFKGLLSNQIGIHDLTALTVIERSKELAIQALLVDPVVSTCSKLSEMLDHIISAQSPWLDYLK